jgi:signal transduction histidine kinase
MHLTKDSMPCRDRRGLLTEEPAARVLLIDADAAANVEDAGGLGHALLEAGYEVAVVGTAQAGVEVARDYHPDAILLASHGPQVAAGIAACERLKTEPELSDVPLLVVEDEIKHYGRQAFEAGVEELIPKQEGADGALVRLRHTLQKKRVAEQLRADLHRVAVELEATRESKEALVQSYRRAQERLAELETENEELRAENRMRASFINAVVHDIRSPLTVILGTLDLLAEEVAQGRAVDGEYYRRTLGDALRSCQEVAHLVNDMLSLAEMQKHRLHALDFELLEVESLVAQAVEAAAGAARQAGITLTSAVEPGLPRLYIDRKQMHRALMNLINNALKFTPRGGEVKVQARLLAEKERRRDALYDYGLLSVIDTGEGLRPDETPYVFDPYWQAENGKRRVGTGLGLSIVKRIAVAHSGNVSVRSTPGKGSNFTIMIPVLDAPPATKFEVEE